MSGLSAIAHYLFSLYGQCKSNIPNLRFNKINLILSSFNIKVKLKIRNTISVCTLNCYNISMFIDSWACKILLFKNAHILQTNLNIIKTKYTNTDKTHSNFKYLSKRKQTLHYFLLKITLSQCPTMVDKIIYAYNKVNTQIIILHIL